MIPIWVNNSAKNMKPFKLKIFESGEVRRKARGETGHEVEGKVLRGGHGLDGEGIACIISA